MARQRGIVVPIQATDNTERAFASVQAQVQALRQQVASLRAQLANGGPGQALADGLGHATPQIAAASGAVRELEGNLPIRAVERFLTTTLGLGPALAAAFPLVGAIAFGGVILEGVNKLRELGKQGALAGEETKKGFASLNEELRISNLELTVTSDKLEDDIAKLEKRPGDGLRTGADEATLAFERLGSAIDRDLEKLTQLLGKNEVGFFSGLLGGAGETKDTSNLLLSVKRDVDKARGDYDKVVQQARDSGDADNIAQAEQARLVALQKAYAKADAALANAQDAAQRVQDHRNSPASTFGVGLTDTASGVKYSSDRDNSANLNILSGGREFLLQEQKQIGGEFRKSQDEQTKSALEGAKARQDLGNKEEAERLKRAEAQEKASAAQRALEDANAKAGAATAKGATDAELDILESKHRALLVSDEDFYKQREAIQARAIQAQRDAITAQRTDLERQVSGAEQSGRGLTGNDAVNNNSRIVELKAKIVELGIKDAQLTGQAAKNTRDRADAETELAQRKIADADRLAAELETERGGSVSARQGQSRDEYLRRRQQLIAEFGSDQAPAVANLDQQQGIDQDSIAAKAADQDLGLGDASRRSQRQGIDDQATRGQISAQQAQREKIALDRDEAAAMQPVLQAYEKLAAEGDLAAAEKVIDLKRKIAELSEPVNEVAAEIRGQFDSAFERLFENIDRGKKAFQDFAKSLESDLLKDIYKSAVEPGIQAALGILIPNSTGQNLPKPGSTGGTLSGILPKIPGFGGAFPDVGKTSGEAKVILNIVNSGSNPVKATDTSGSFDQDAKQFIVHTVLEDMAGGGPLSHLFA